MDRIKFKKLRNVSIAFFSIWLFAIIVYGIFTVFVEVTLTDTALILLFETVLCLAMWGFFTIKIEWLKDIGSGREIYYLNISNVLSALRFSLVPLLIAMFNITMRHENSLSIKASIFIFGGFICLTDLFDGLLARKLNEVTKLGMVLDPMGDFLMITCFTILVFKHAIITWWFFALTMLRIPGMVAMMIYLVIFDIKFRIKTSLLGKSTIFFLLTFLAFAAVKLFFEQNSNGYDLFLLILQAIGAVIIVASIIEKFIHLSYFAKNQDDNQNENIQI